MPRNTITLYERCDIGALKYIVNNFDSFGFRPETDPQETLSMTRKYLTSCAPDGSRKVSYRQSTHGTGRYFAKGGMSLQGMAREIRNAISYPYYEDLDFINCHPSLLSQQCRKLGIACPHLDEYCIQPCSFIMGQRYRIPL